METNDCSQSEEAVTSSAAAVDSAPMMTPALTFDTKPLYPRDFDTAFLTKRRRYGSSSSNHGDNTLDNGSSNSWSLPRVVRLGLPTTSSAAAHVPVTGDDDVIMIETRRSVKCVARPLVWDSEAKLYTYASSQSYLIPMNFAGWMCHLEEFCDSHVRRFTSVAELAAARGYISGVTAEQRCPCLVSTATRQPRLRYQAEDTYVKGTVDVGDVLYPEGVLRGLRSGSRSLLLCRRSSYDDVTTCTYLQCRNNRGQRVLLNTAQVHNGGCCCSFLALRADGDHTSGCAFLLSDIIGHVTSSAPIRVKLIVDEDEDDAAIGGDSDGQHLEQPIGAYELTDVICENVIVASKVRQRLQLFEIPSSSRVKIYPTNNKYATEETNLIKQFLKRTLTCSNDNGLLDLLNAIRPSAAEFWEQFQFDNDVSSTTSPIDTMVLAGYPVTRKEMLTRQLSAAHLAEDVGDDYATLPADSRAAAGFHVGARTSIDDDVIRRESRDDDALSWRSKVTDSQLESSEGYLLPEAAHLKVAKVTTAAHDVHVESAVPHHISGTTSRPLTPTLHRPPAPLPLPFKHVYPKPDVDSSLDIDDVDYVNNATDVTEGFERTISGRSRCLSSVSEYQQGAGRKSLMQRLSERLNTRLRLEMAPVMTEKGGEGGGRGSTRNLATPSPTALRPPMPLPGPPEAPATSVSVDSGFTASSVSLYADFGRNNSRDWAADTVVHQPWAVSAEVKDMSVEEVCVALMHIGFSRHDADLFLEAQVDGQQLVELTEELLLDAFPSLNGLQRKKVLDFARGWRPRRWKSADLLTGGGDLDTDPYLVNV